MVINVYAKTSPEKSFPAPAPVEEPEDVEANRLREKRAIAALANSLLSIGGAGFAAWWAAEKTGWANEWVRSLNSLVEIKHSVEMHRGCCLLCSWRL